MAAEFGGTASDYLSGPHLGAAYPFSIFCWVKFNDLTNGGCPIVLGSDSTSPFRTHHALLVDSTPNINAITYYDGAPTFRFANTSFVHSTGEWVGAGAVWEHSGSPDTTLFYNGNEYTDEGVFANYGSDNQTLLGVLHNQDGFSFPLDGAVDHIAHWNGRLTAAEGRMLMAGYSPLFVRPDILDSYLVQDENGNFIDLITNATFTKNGTVNHVAGPQIIMPEDQDIWIPPSAEAAAAVQNLIKGANLGGNLIGPGLIQ